MRPAQISSTQNPRLKAVAQLRDASARREAGHSLIEGHREISRALQAGVPVVSLWYCPAVFGAREAEADAVVAQAGQAGVELIELSPQAMAKVSARQNPDGLIAVARIVERPLADIPLGLAPLVVVVEGVEKPGNLGALLRTAEAAGADAVIATDPATDFHNPNVIRAAQGASFLVPTAVATPEEIAAWLAANGLAVAATAPDADALLWDFDFRRPAAILLGSEAWGLSAFWLESGGACAGDTAQPAVTPVRLPMAGASDSLNVAATAAIALFEAVRQRGRSGG